HHYWPHLILLCASALAVLLWSAAPARAAAFDDQTASLFPAPPALTLESWAACWGDYNNDGYVDVNAGGRLWKNNGGTSFTFAHWLSAGPWGDYNNDGLLDSYGSHSNSLYRNQSSGGTTSFVQDITMPPVPAGSGVSQYTNRGASWADYNGDGYVDLFVTGYETGGMSPYNDTLMMNNSGTSFSGSTIGSAANAR
ncbi:MAG: VCBS repeat-containing protein, partial [Phycisphaerae bacterium]|nr:VCBS repeat-containing protein [Phycisphaerae bacterium]